MDIANGQIQKKLYILFLMQSRTRKYQVPTFLASSTRLHVSLQHFLSLVLDGGALLQVSRQLSGVRGFASLFCLEVCSK